MFVAKLGRQFTTCEPVEAGAFDMHLFKLRQPLNNVQGFPGNRRAAEVQVLQSAEDAELTYRRVGNRASSQIELAKLQQFVALADEILNKLFSARGLVEPDTEDRFGELRKIAERFLPQSPRKAVRCR